MQRPQLNLPDLRNFDFTMLQHLVLRYKRLLMMAVAGIAGIFILWWIVLLVVFSEDSAREELKLALQQYFGREVTLGEQSQFSVFPSPELIVTDVNVANHPRSSQPNMIVIPQLKVSIDAFSSLFGSLVGAVAIESPKVLLETFDDGESNWKMEASAKDSEEAEMLLREVTIQNGVVQYRYPAKDREWQLQDWQGQVNFSSPRDANALGSFKMGNASYQFYADIEEAGDFETGIKAGVTDGNLELHADGEWNSKDQKFTGKQRTVFADLGAFLESFTQALSPEEKDALKAAKATLKPIPLKWEGDMDFDTASQQVTLKELQIDGRGMEGTAEAKITIAAEPIVVLALQMKKLSLQPLEKRGVLGKLLTQQETTQTLDGTKIGVIGGKIRGLPQGVTINTMIVAEEAKFAGVPIQGLQMAAKLENAMIVFPQVSGKLDGEGQFILKGVVENSYEGMALKGQLDFGGKDLGKSLSVLTGQGILAPERLKQYRGRGNLFFTKDILRISEMIFRSEDLQILGTVLRKRNAAKELPMLNAKMEIPRVAYFYDAALRVDKLNLDEWHEAQQDPVDESLKEYPKLMRLAKGWQQRSLQSESQIKISFVDLFLNEKNRGKANLSMAINGGGVALNRFELPYNGTFISGSLSVGFPQLTIPIVGGDIKVDMLNTAEFFEHDFSKDESFWRDEKGAWSRKEFVLDWMHRFNGKIKFEAAHLKHDIMEFDNLKLEANLQEGLGQISQFSANTLGGQMTFRGQLTASKLPSMSCNVGLSNASFEKLRTLTDMVGDLTGNLSISGEFSSTGINPQIVVQNSQGSIAVAGAGITVKGFNLENLTRAANTVRTVADIKKLVDYADQGGATYIDSLKGNVVLGGGFLRSPGILIATKEGSGSMSGQLGLTDWDLSGSITLYLTVLQPQSPPSIRLVFAGPLHKTARTLETQSLESFIAKQSAERILDTQ